MKTETIGTLKNLVWVVTTSFILFFFFEDRYANAEQSQKSHEEIRKDMIVSELRHLSAKAKKIKLEVWEQLRKEDLERLLKELSK